MPRSRRRSAAATVVPASVHNAVLAKAHKRVDKLEGRLARVIQPLLDQAGEQAAERFTRLATNHLAAAAANSDIAATATMICVRPRPDEAEAIADPDGDAPDLLHVTLVYLGQVEGDQALADVVEALKPVAAQFAPLEGVVGGYGLFDPAGVGVLLPDVRGLVELRVAVCEALLDAGIDYGRDHGFEAHITVHRDPTSAEQEAALERAAGEPLHFDSIYVVRGNAEESELPLVGVPALTADAGFPPPPSWTAPFPEELMNVSQFVRLILEKTDPVRKAMIEQTMTPALREAGLSFDVTNPLTNATLASTAAQVKGIAETTQLNLMQIIRSSYRNGLSIPQTASLIREGMKSASKTRATMIARTELARGVNGGSLAATQLVASATGSQYDKRWETAAGAKYPRHEDYPDLDGQIVALNATFTVGADQLQYPSDPDGSPEETINCRCAMTYHTPEGEQTANAEEPPTLDTADTAGGGGGAGQITLPSDALTAHLTPLNGTSANGLAISLETRAREIEPALTAVMKESAKANGAELGGLAHRLKNEESATRKIASDALERNETVRETAYGVSDMVRYTALYEPDQYVAGAQAMLKDLQARGLRVVRFRNTWEPHAPYAGVNIQMAAANGYRFELQFHTPDSFELKNGIQHKLYDKWRVLPAGDPLRAELTQEMAANTDALMFPPGVDKLTYEMDGTSAELGVTPFRPEDDPIGFYNSAKYQEFVDRAGTTANDYGVTIEGFDHMTGVWQGETEPSVAIRAHDHELGLQAFASKLGLSYEQDGVLVFGKGGDDVLATFPKSSQEDAFKAMKAAGFDAGRMTTGGQLQVIGPDTAEFRERLVRVWDDLGEPKMESGSFSLIENGDYQKMIDAYAAPPPTAAELAAMPRTVEDIVPGASAEVLATVREDIERRVSTYAQKHHMTHDEYLDAALASIREGVADPTVRIRVKPEDLASIIEDGRFKSQFETDTSGGMLDNDFRAKAEKNMFGYPTDLPPAERPIYAYLAGSASETGAITGYGHVIVNLKDEANFRTTFSTSDSLGFGGAGGLSPSPLLEPSLESWTIGTDPVDAAGRLADLRNGSYVEAQVHGGVTTDDIADIWFSRTEERNKIDGWDSVVTIREHELAGMEQRLQELLDSPESVPADIYPGAVEKARERVADAQAQLDHWKKVAEDAALEGPKLRTLLDELGIPWKMLENFEGLVGPAI